ncbi:MAG: type II secretion system protein [Planctomycetota bacterium]
MHVTNSGISQNQKRQKRRGFTLVELLVVIAIIGILAALLIPAVFFAVTSARRAQISVEMANIQKALESYKTQAGEYPPDFTHNPNATATRFEQINQQLAQHLARNFRNRNSAIDAPLKIDVNTNSVIPWPTGTAFATAVTNELPNIDPAEALVLALRGFSKDPSLPLSGAGDRQALFEFDARRLSDRDMDGFLEYYPPGDSQKMPYTYFKARSASEADAYNVATLFVESTRTTAPTFMFSLTDANGDSALPLPYLADRKVPDATAPENADGTSPAYAEPKKFQLLCAGLDGAYGGTIRRAIGSGIVAGNEKDDMASFLDGQTMLDYRESQ